MSSSADTPKVVYSHGRDSGPWGSKIRHLANIAGDLGYAVESINYQGMYDPQQRIEHLLSHQIHGAPLVMVGSSMGGYVSAMTCEQLAPTGLFLMAPALYLPDYPGEPRNCPANTVVVHGWQDDIVPVQSSIDFARSRQAELHVLNDGHPLKGDLTSVGRWFAALLERCLQA